MINTALFLYEAGMGIRLVRYLLYQTAAGQRNAHGDAAAARR
jgi:hypothetical protein